MIKILEAFKEMITKEVEVITTDMTGREMHIEQLQRLANQCLNNEGCRLSDILFKTQLIPRIRQ